MIRLRFLVNLGGWGGGCTEFTVLHFPLHGLLCFSVMSEIHLFIRGFQSPSAPSPTPASPSQSSLSQGAAAVCRTYSLCLRRRVSIVTFNRLTFLYCVPFFIFAAGCARYEQRRFFLLLYIRHRLSIHYSQSKPKASAPPPSAPSAPSP